MKEKVVFILLAVSLVLVGCSTMNVAVQKTLDVPIAGVKTVVIDLVMSDRLLPIFPLIDAGIYNSGVNAIRPDLIKIDAQKSVELADAVDSAYRDKLGSETVRTSNPFSKTLLPYDFYENLSDPAKRKIGELCATNEADLALAYTFRIHTSGVGWFGVSGSSFGSALFYVFDRNGSLVAKGTLQTESRSAGSKDTGSYILLFNDTKALVPKLFIKMGQ